MRHPGKLDSVQALATTTTRLHAKKRLAARVEQLFAIPEVTSPRPEVAANMGTS
jgi:hypothetical protein